VPVGGQHEQRRAGFAAEHAREARPVGFDPLPDLATLVDTNAAGPAVSPTRPPHRALGIDADAVTEHVGPDSPIEQAAVCRDVEGGERAGERLGDDQRRVVGGHRHPIGEGDLIGDLTYFAFGGDERDDAGRFSSARVELAAAVEVDVAAPVDDDLVEVADGETAGVDVFDKGPVRFQAEQARLGPRDDQQPAVRQPIDRERDGGGHAGNQLAPAGAVDRNDLLRSPVGEPETTVMPPGRLADH